MRILIPVEARFLRAPDGTHWVRSPSHYAFWSRYLAAFDSVRVAARVCDVLEVPREFNRVDGPNVEVWGLPNFVGAVGLLRESRRYRAALQLGLQDSEAVMLRLPGQASITTLRLLETGRPYGVEVVGDPYEVFAKGVVSHPMRPLLRILFAHALRRAVARASCVAYVTSKSLQQRYPSSPHSFVTNYSSVELDASAVGERRRRHDEGLLRCITVGSLDQPYKGVDLVIRAVAECRSRGLPTVLTVVGDGRLLEEYRRLASSLGVETSVNFTGQLPSGDAVRQQLDDSDIFVLASRTEGLPRAMIEAMARGLPCIGSRVGGIPELLPDESLMRVNDVTGLADHLERLVNDRGRFERASAWSLKIALNYSSDVLGQRRKHMFEFLREATSRWAMNRSG